MRMTEPYLQMSTQNAVKIKHVLEHLVWEYQQTNIIIAMAQLLPSPAVSQLLISHTTVTTNMHILIRLAKSQLASQ